MDDRLKSGEEVYRSVPSAVPSKKRSTQDGTCPSGSKRFAQSDYNGMWWTATNNQTGQAWNVPLTGYSQASIWPGVTTAVAWNEAASRWSQSSAAWSWGPVAVNQVAYSQPPSTIAPRPEMAQASVKVRMRARAYKMKSRLHQYQQHPWSLLLRTPAWDIIST